MSLFPLFLLSVLLLESFMGYYSDHGIFEVRTHNNMVKQNTMKREEKLSVGNKEKVEGDLWKESNSCP